MTAHLRGRPYPVRYVMTDDAAVNSDSDVVTKCIYSATRLKGGFFAWVSCHTHESIELAMGQGASWDAPRDPTPSLVSPVWALCKVLKVPFVTKIDRHFRLKIAISSQVGYLIKPVRI